MKVTDAPLAGLKIIEPDIFTDNRGYFSEVFQQKRYAELGLPPFVQDNISRSKRHVIRGLHYQLPNPQGKLVWVSRGTVLDVIVDIRIHSETFGQWFSIQLDDQKGTQLYIPPGFAHGFCVLSEEADFYYKCTDFYSPGNEHGIAWNDKNLAIDWPIDHPILSRKDAEYPRLSDIPNEKLFA